MNMLNIWRSQGGTKIDLKKQLIHPLKALHTFLCFCADLITCFPLNLLFVPCDKLVQNYLTWKSADDLLNPVLPQASNFSLTLHLEGPLT